MICPMGGAGHFARTVEAIKEKAPEIYVEVLIPDFCGDKHSLARIVRAQPDVIAHNLETVERLTGRVRDPRAGYAQSLEVLKKLKQLGASYTKSSIMLGLGENPVEIDRAMDDLLSVGVSVLTFGQYLRPSLKHLPVEEYITPQAFKILEIRGLNKGFLYVASGPLVRSSYKAGELFLEGLLKKEKLQQLGLK